MDSDVATRAATGRIPRWLRPAPDSMAAYMRRSGHRPILQAFNLLWSLWLVVPVFFFPLHAAYVMSLLLGYPLLLVLFWLVHVRPYHELRYYSSAMALLGCLSMPFNPAGWTCGIFGCVYVPYDGDLRPSILWMMLEVLVMVAVALMLGWPWTVQLMMVGISCSAGFGGLMSRVNGMKRASEQRSRAKVRRLAANAERERIGRDLHDLLGHTLSLITLKLELARKLFDVDAERARTELGEAEDVARHALTEVRAAVTGMRATGLVGELASARLILGTSEVTLHADVVPELPDVIDDTLAMVLREAATNIHRHARARQATVELRRASDTIRMRIHDDGRGGVHEAGNGLCGMRERVRALGGRLDIRSVAGTGTELVVQLPLPAPADEPAPATMAAGGLSTGEAS